MWLCAEVARTQEAQTYGKVVGHLSNLYHTFFLIIPFLLKKEYIPILRQHGDWIITFYFLALKGGAE